jgi:hypothetical protein
MPSRALALTLLIAGAALAQPIEFPKLTDAEKKKLDDNGCVVHELKPTGVRSKSGQPLLHPLAYYTLNEIPR